MLKLAGAEGLEPSTVGFGDRCSTIRTMLLQDGAHFARKHLLCKVFFAIFFTAPGIAPYSPRAKA